MRHLKKEQEKSRKISKNVEIVRLPRKKVLYYQCYGVSFNSLLQAFVIFLGLRSSRRLVDFSAGDS